MWPSVTVCSVSCVVMTECSCCILPERMWCDDVTACLSVSTVAKSSYKNQESELLSDEDRGCTWNVSEAPENLNGFSYTLVLCLFLENWLLGVRKSVRYFAGKLVNSLHSKKVISPNFSSTFMWVVRGSQGSIPHLNPQHSSSYPGYRAEEEGVTPFVWQCIEINALKSQRKRLLCLT